jgi:hypothetical protein
MTNVIFFCVKATLRIAAFVAEWSPSAAYRSPAVLALILLMNLSPCTIAQAQNACLICSFDNARKTIGVEIDYSASTVSLGDVNHTAEGPYRARISSSTIAWESRQEVESGPPETISHIISRVTGRYTISNSICSPPCISYLTCQAQSCPRTKF